MATDERLDVETEKLGQISGQITQLSAIVEDTKAKKQSAKQDGADVSLEGMTNQVISGIRNELISQQAKLSQLQERFGDMHPQVKETKSVIAEMKRRLELEYGQTSQFIGASSNMASERLAAAKASLEQQKQKLIELREKRAGASVLSRDVENLQRAYDVVQSRVSQSGIEVQVASTSLAVLEKANIPQDPSTPRPVLNTVVAFILGSLLAVAAALLVEMLDQRVRTNQDLQQQLGVPLIGVLLKTENASKGLLTRRVPPWVIHRGTALPSPTPSNT